MPVMILVRSLTHGQRALNIVRKSGIPAVLVKAPAGSWEKGCAYALRLDRRRLSKALEALSSAGISYLRVITADRSGNREEVTP